VAINLKPQVQQPTIQGAASPTTTIGLLEENANA